MCMRLSPFNLYLALSVSAVLVVAVLRGMFGWLFM
jgi:hypothetical protein